MFQDLPTKSTKQSRIFTYGAIYRRNQLNNSAFLRMDRSDTIMELSKWGQTWRTILDAMNSKITDRLSLKTDNYQLCINLPTILKKLGGVTPPPRLVRPCLRGCLHESRDGTIAAGRDE